MTQPTPPDDIDHLWQSQETPKMNMTIDRVSHDARAFQIRVRVRNALEYAAGAIVLGAFGHMALDASQGLFVRIGALVTLVGTVVVLTHVRLRGHAAEAAPSHASTTRQVIAWHRAELSRQRDLLRRVPRWYVGPLVPGMALVIVGRGLDANRLGPALVAALGCTLVMAAVLWVNARAAAKLDERIASLPADDDLA